jgi:hypothetical protein
MRRPGVRSPHRPPFYLLQPRTSHSSSPYPQESGWDRSQSGSMKKSPRGAPAALLCAEQRHGAHTPHGQNGGSSLIFDNCLLRFDKLRAASSYNARCTLILVNLFPLKGTRTKISREAVGGELAGNTQVRDCLAFFRLPRQNQPPPHERQALVHCV